MSETPTPQARKAQRYDLMTNYRAGSSIEEMERSDDGEWVRWEAVEAALASKDRDLATLAARASRLEDAAFHFQACVTCARDGEDSCLSGSKFAAFLRGEEIK